MTDKIKIAFYGTSPFAAEILEGIVSDTEIVCVVTRPDSIAKRGRKLVPSAVKTSACKYGLCVVCPAKLNKDDSDYDKTLQLVSNADVAVVASYGNIIPQILIEAPRYGTLNVHASLLPRWRGAAPIERSILAGDEYTGVTIMQLDAGLDTGNIVSQEKIAIEACDANETLSAKIARTGVRLLEKAFSNIADKIANKDNLPLHSIEQDECGVCYAEKIGKGELDLLISDSAADALKKIRASSASHPTHVRLAERDVVILEAAPFKNITDMKLEAGLAMFFQKKLVCAFEDGMIEIKRVKPAGKNEMDARAFCAGAIPKSKVVSWTSNA